MAASYRQLAGYLKDRPKPCIIILTDAMSPVPGFEPLAEAFFDQARADGAELMSVEQAASLLS